METADAGPLLVFCLEKVSQGKKAKESTNVGKEETQSDIRGMEQRVWDT